MPIFGQFFVVRFIVMLIEYIATFRLKIKSAMEIHPEKMGPTSTRSHGKIQRPCLWTAFQLNLSSTFIILQLCRRNRAHLSNLATPWQKEKYFQSVHWHLFHLDSVVIHGYIYTPCAKLGITSTGKNQAAFCSIFAGTEHSMQIEVNIPLAIASAGLYTCCSLISSRLFMPRTLSLHLQIKEANGINWESQSADHNYMPKRQQRGTKKIHSE